MGLYIKINKKELFIFSFLQEMLEMGPTFKDTQLSSAWKRNWERLETVLRFRMYPLVSLINFWMVCVTYRRVLDWMIRSIDTLCTHLWTTRNYTYFADLHALQFTVTQALEFSVFSLQADFQLTTELTKVKVSHVTSDGQSASLSWNKAPIWG
jgi:hypothetical protein